MKKIVNRWFLGYLFGHLGGGADDVDKVAKYANLNVNDKDSVSIVIKESCVPLVLETQSDLVRERLKTALQYYLTTNEIDFSSVFDAYLLPFRCPSNAKNFFLWIWDALYPDENPSLSAEYEYIVLEDGLDDYNAIYRDSFISRRHPGPEVFGTVEASVGGAVDLTQRTGAKAGEEDADSNSCRKRLIQFDNELTEHRSRPATDDWD